MATSAATTQQQRCTSRHEEHVKVCTVCLGGFIWKQKNETRQTDSSTVSCADCFGGKAWVWSALLWLQSLEHGDVHKLLSHAPHVDLQRETPDSGSFCQSCIVTSYIHLRETFSHSSLTLCDYAEPEAGENCGFEDIFKLARAAWKAQ